MNKAILSLIAMTAVAGCATTDVPVEDAAERQAKLGVTQVGQKQNADFVFCAEGKDCPKRTPKYLPVPKPEPKPVASIESQKPSSFKVHFRWGSSTLDKSGRGELDQVVGSGLVKSAKSITVAGRTDPTGSRSFNEKLALKRASTVKAALVMAGVPENIIKAEAQAPCCDGDKKAAPAEMRELRRTDITITITTK